MVPLDPLTCALSGSPTETDGRWPAHSRRFTVLHDELRHGRHAPAEVVCYIATSHVVSHTVVLTATAQDEMRHGGKYLPKGVKGKRSGANRPGADRVRR